MRRPLVAHVLLGFGIHAGLRQARHLRRDLGAQAGEIGLRRHGRVVGRRFTGVAQAGFDACTPLPNA